VPDRHTADTITDDALEALYEQLAQANSRRAALHRAQIALAEQAAKDQSALARVRQMADAWEQRLPDTIRTATAVEAIRHAVNGDTRPVMFEVSARAAKAERAVDLLAEQYRALEEQLVVVRSSVDRVRQLHQRWDADANSCAHCHDGYGNPLHFPCPTIRALDPKEAQ